ncbi:MAG TPA: S53 family peptidase, partial [Candidatus Nitrosotalea sp.]|nr:S53 family peptidase [Candidatus Nitrosotalea sp.]
PGATPVADLSAADVFLTAWLRPRRGGKLDVEHAIALGSMPPPKRAYAERAELAAQTGADPADITLLARYCKRFGIEVVASYWRHVTLTGSIHELVKAFGATAGIYELEDKRRFRHRSQSLHAPPEIAAILHGVFGIHQWPRSHAIGQLTPHTVPPSASDIAARYAFPDGDGSGETIAIVQLRGEFRPDDFAACMQSQGVSAKKPIVKRVDNAELAHGIETAKDLESAIDTQIAGALAPGAQIVIYAAPDDERGVLDAIRHVIFDDERKPSILSVSFGFPEYLWTPAALAILDELFTAAALLGITVFCASGDNGAELDAKGGAHVLAPASSPFAHACGGTQIADDGSEVVWPKTGGGFSERFGVPPWQHGVAAAAKHYKMNPGRGLPDVAGNSIPGYRVYFNGQPFAMGGTSAVAPMWAALTARLSQRLGKPLGFFAPLLYSARARGALREITPGANDRYASAPGWDPCTGLGVPIGTALEALLAGDD